MKTRIGITSNVGTIVAERMVTHNLQETQQLGDYYVKAIERAGGIPVVLPVYHDLSLVKDAVDSVDGVILSGGADIDPMLFGQRASSKLCLVSPRRDAFDLAVAKYVLKETKKPILGICRGVQVMNVAMGGNLYVDLEEDGKLAHSLNMFHFTEISHQVKVSEGTKLAVILGSGSVGVNSFHHQAVRDAAEGFVVAARSIPDEVPEAIELPGERFVVGVQWHPEWMYSNPEQQKIFEQLVEAAEKR